MAPPNATEAALERMRSAARRLVSRQETPLHGANAIYVIARDAEAYGQSGYRYERLATIGAEFLQLADALEEKQDAPRSRQELENLIVEAAQALLSDVAFPEWWIAGDGSIRRGLGVKNA